LYGALVPLGDGTTVRADETYLRASILQPASHTVAGYQPVMPAYQGRVSEEQLMELIAYIKSVAHSEPLKKP